MTSIVYSSKSGSTRRYAEALSERTGLPVYPVGKQPAEDRIIFFGWLRYDFVVGLDRARKNDILALCIVGLDDPSSVSLTRISDRNKVSLPTYYLRGQLDRSRLNPIDKFVFAVICARMKLKGLDERTKPVFDAMMEGGSFYDEAFLEPIETFVASKK